MDPADTIQPPAEVAPASTPEVAAPPPAAPAKVQAALLTLPTPEPDPAARADAEKLKLDAAVADRKRAEEAAEAERARIREEVRLELKAEAEEAARVAEMTAKEQLEHQLKLSAEADARQKAELEAAKAELNAAGQKLRIAQALSTSGLRLVVRGDGSPDAALQELAYNKIAEKTAAGLSEAEAIRELRETDPHYFARGPEAPPALTSTSPGQGAPRGTTSSPRAPAAPPEESYMAVPKEKFERYIATKGWRADMHEVQRPN